MRQAKPLRQVRVNAAILLVAISGLAFFSAPCGGNFSTPNTTTMVSLSTTSLFFGSVTVDTTSAGQTVTLKNVGRAALSITSMSITGANASNFAQTNNCGSSVASGGSCTISVTFTPTATGTRSGTLSISDNAIGIGQTVSLSGVGITPVVVLSPTALSFASRAAGTTSAAQAVTVRNVGSGVLEITSLAITGTDAGDFAQTNNCGSSVASESSCTVSVTFTPTASGSRSASLSIADNASGSPQTVTLTGTGTGTSSGGIVLPLKASSNRRYLTDQSGTPFLLMGDSAWGMMATLPSSSFATYMSERQTEGFNAFLADIICGFCDGDGGPANGLANDGTPPFTSGTTWSSYDLSTPNPSYFAEVDSMVNLAKTYNLVVFLNPLDNYNFMTTLENNGTTKTYNYGAYLGNRYKGFTNIVWCFGNDFQDWNSSSTDNQLAYELMAGIASADSNHLQTIELNYDASYSNQDTSELSSVLTLDGAYTYYETYAEVLLAYASSPTLPTFLIEANYEGENDTGFFTGTAGVFILREQEYWTMTSGATGQLYGNHYTYTFPSGWQTHLTDPGALEVKYVNALFSAYNWWQFLPDTTHQVVTSGYGTYNGSNGNLPDATYCTTTWDGSTTSITYCPNSSTLTVDMAVFNSEVTARWYDPSNGTYLSISGSPFANSGTQIFTSPGMNNDDDPDWVLVLQTSGSND